VIVPRVSEGKTSTGPKKITIRERWARSSTGRRATIIVSLVVALLTVSALLKHSEQSGPVIETSVGKEVRIGDIGVTITRAGISGYRSTSPSGHPLEHQPDFVVALDFKSYNPDRILQAQYQTGRCKLVDDVGNRYSEIKTETEAGFRSAIDGQITYGMARDLRSDARGTDVLVFDRPVPGAKTLILTLDAKAYGGTGTIRVRILK
jgi:hypothetical protein